MIEKLTVFLTPTCARRLHKYPFHLEDGGFRKAACAAQRVYRIVMNHDHPLRSLKCLEKLSFEDSQWYPQMDPKLKRFAAFQQVICRAARVETTVDWREGSAQASISDEYRAQIRFYAKSGKEPLGTLTLYFRSDGSHENLTEEWREGGSKKS